MHRHETSIPWYKSDNFQENFYKDVDEDKRTTFNYDDPDATDWTYMEVE